MASLLRTLVLYTSLSLLLWPAAFAAESGAPAPAFELPDSSGVAVSLADYSGQLVYVDFWASWCGPCIVSFPVMEDLHQRYEARGLTILAINVDQRREDADRFLTKRKVSFPILFDGTGATPGAYAVKGMPTSFLVDGEGNVIHVHEGFKKSDGPRLEALIKEALGI